MEDEWIQTEAIHCPKRECKGMLLTNPYHHEHKCSDCKQLYMKVCTWEQIHKDLNTTN